MAWEREMCFLSFIRSNTASLPLPVTHGQCDARPTVTFPANGWYQFILLGEQRHIVCEQLAQSRLGVRKIFVLHLVSENLQFGCSYVP